MHTANRRGRRPRSGRAGLQSPSAVFHALFLLLALIVIVDFVEEATAVRLERAVIDARRAAGIGRRLEALAALALGVVADNQIARDEVDLFPVVVHERRGCVHPRIEAQKPRAAAHLAGLVEIAGQRLLLNAGGVARRREPAVVHVDALELEMWLVERHVGNPGGVSGAMVAADAAKVKIAQ